MIAREHINTLEQEMEGCGKFLNEFRGNLHVVSRLFEVTLQVAMKACDFQKTMIDTMTTMEAQP